MSIHQTQSPTRNDAKKVEELERPAQELTIEESKAVTGGMQLRAKRSEVPKDGVIEIESYSFGG